MQCADVMDRLSPYLDDELDPVASREVARHLDTCPGCAAALARRRELSESLRRDLEYHPAPDLLRARVMRDVRAATRPDRAPTRPGAWRWVSAAASVAAVVGVTWLLGTQMRDRANDAIAHEAVSGH